MRLKFVIVTLINSLYATLLHADVDKVYHPYVESDTYEFETRIISFLDSELAASFSVYRFGFGKDITDHLFLELYLIGAKNTSHNVELEAYEIEALYQLTEQGEYWADFGLLFEVEKERESKEWEGDIGLIVEKELGRWSATLNIKSNYFFDNNKQHNWNLSQNFQMRYRYSSDIEPGIEIFSDKNDFFIGPVILGKIRLNRRQLNWELGIVQEVNHSKSESIIRALIEYEF